jgi:TRAP transporter TAXI family solute receptor
MDERPTPLPIDRPRQHDRQRRERQRSWFWPGVVLLTVLSCVAALTACAGGTGATALANPPPTHVRLTSGIPGAGFHPLGAALRDSFARVLPSVVVDVQESPGAVRNLQALQRGQADLGFAFADVAYMAYTGGLDEEPKPFDRIRGIAVLQLTPLHLLVRADGGINRLEDLPGHRVSLGPVGSGTALTSSIVVRAFGIDPQDLRMERRPFNDATDRLLAGAIDAAFVDAAYPADAVVHATRGGARILPVEGPAVNRLRAVYPFLRVTAIPGGTYPNHAAHVPTVGIDSVLVCRADLPEALVYALTRALFDSLPTLSAGRTWLQEMDVAQAPATPVPLHDGARRYYRERELTR